MCITAQCPDPTEVGVWWRDDAAWKLYSKQTMRAILMALLKGNSSLHLELTSSVHARGASYHIDLLKMEQTNRASGHKRAIKLILPSSLKKFFSKVEHSIEVESDGSMVRFRMKNSCLLVIRKGNLAEWAVNGKADAVVCPLRRWGYQGFKGVEKSSWTTSSRTQTRKTEILCSDTIDVAIGHDVRRGSFAGSGDVNGLAVAGGHQQVHEQRRGSVCASSRIQTCKTEILCSDMINVTIGHDVRRGSFTGSDDVNGVAVAGRHQQVHEQRRGSVSAALHGAAGVELQEALHKGVRFAVRAGRCGDAVITPGFKLPASHIIHTIVPRYCRSSDNAGTRVAPADDTSSGRLLERAYKSAAALALENGMSYLAFPAMACGAAGFPVEVAARVAMQALVGNVVDGLKEIHFVVMGELFKEWVTQASRLLSKHEP